MYCNDYAIVAVRLVGRLRIEERVSNIARKTTINCGKNVERVPRQDENAAKVCVFSSFDTVYIVAFRVGGFSRAPGRGEERVRN